MHQPAVGEVREPGECIVVVVADRFTAKVTRRHDQHSRAGLVAVDAEQEHMQRRVGQHDPEVRIARRYGFRDVRVGKLLQQLMPDKCRC